MMSYRQHFKLDFTDCCQSYLCTVFHWHFVGRLSSQTLLSLAIYSKSAAIVLKLWNEGSPHLFCALAVCHCIRRVSSQKWYTTVQSNIALIRDLLYISNYFSLSVHSGVLIMLVVLLLQCIYWYFFFSKALKWRLSTSILCTSIGRVSSGFVLATCSIDNYWQTSVFWWWWWWLWWWRCCLF